jgi:hypothetical protein
MLKYFTNALEGNASQSLAINPAHVITVFQSIYTKEVEVDEETTSKKVKKIKPTEKKIVTEDVTSIYVMTNIVYHVTDSYLEVVARLNERD